MKMKTRAAGKKMKTTMTRAKAMMATRSEKSALANVVAAIRSKLPVLSEIACFRQL